MSYLTLSVQILTEGRPVAPLVVPRAHVGRRDEAAAVLVQHALHHGDGFARQVVRHVREVRQHQHARLVAESEHKYVNIRHYVMVISLQHET